MRRSRRVRFARTMRWATAGSGSSSARAISAVDSPPRQRRVSATRLAGESTGWQAVKTSRNRSSPTWSSRTSSASPSAACSRTSRSRAKADIFASWVTRRRAASTARFLAVVISQPAGFGGTPVRGQVSSAATRASCACSSAHPTSPVSLARPAIRRADSIRHTASPVRGVVSCPVLTIGGPATRDAAAGSPYGDPAAEVGTSGRRGEVLRAEHLEHVRRALPLRPHLPVQVEEAGRPLDGLLLGADLVDGVADDLLGLGEGPVADEQVAAADLQPAAGRARREAGGVEQGAGAGGLAAEAGDGLHETGRGRGRGLAALEQDQVAHDDLLVGCGRRAGGGGRGRGGRRFDQAAR